MLVVPRFREAYSSASGFTRGALRGVRYWPDLSKPGYGLTVGVSMACNNAWKENNWYKLLKISEICISPSPTEIHSIYIYFFPLNWWSNFFMIIMIPVVRREQSMLGLETGKGWWRGEWSGRHPGTTPDLEKSIQENTYLQTSKQKNGQVKSTSRGQAVAHPGTAHEGGQGWLPQPTTLSELR